jgi:Flp pilus assembly protein TadG
VSSIRARLLRPLRRHGADERGFETAETVIVLPVVLILIFVIIQGALWYHSTNLVQAAATSAYESARLYNATESDGVQAGRATATQAGTILSDVKVTVTRTATDVTATVSAHTPSLIPGANTTVTKTITGPTERWVGP